MPVDSQHEEYTASLERWLLVRDCVKGQDAIKAKRETYLPKPNPDDTSTFNATRYNQYLQRANYINVTGRTCNSLLGAIFRKSPTIEIPSQIEYTLMDTDGGGLSAEQMAKCHTRNVMETGRSGLLVDYPPSPAGATREQTQDIKSRIIEYKPESILNWKTQKKDGKNLLTQVVLLENVSIDIDEFQTQNKKQYRVLSLNGGVYYQTVYNENEEVVESDIIPRKSDGSFWNIIPFVFIGSEENNPDVDASPLYDIASTNIGHYRNSADYEEGIFIHGQGTLFISSEQSNEQFKEANPNGILVGARAGHFLGQNGSATLIQMSENNAAREAMLDKQEQMISIGARLITSKSQNETAEAARIGASSESSILSTIADNVSDAITQALKYVCEFMGGNPDEVKFELNKEFFDSKLDPQMIMALIQLADRGDIAKSDIRHDLRKANFFKDGRTDEEIDEEAEVSIL